MESRTTLEIEMWYAWIMKQWNEPSRTDHYIMRAIAEIVAAVGQLRQGLNPDRFRIQFKFTKKSAAVIPLDPARQLEADKSRWAAMVGLVRRRKK